MALLTISTCVLLVFAAVTSAGPTPKVASPDLCFKRSNLDQFMRCWSDFIIMDAMLSEEDWQSSVGKEDQRADWEELIFQMLESDGTCQNLEIPESIRDFYQITLLNDQDNKASFCVLSEKTLSGSRFEKGWGIFIVPYYQNWTDFNVHYSAAHPVTDGEIHLQAVALFLRTRGRSVVVPGMTRNASAVQSECEPQFYRTDGAHDTSNMFHYAQIATHTWQFQPSRASKCKPANCAFFQFHGKSVAQGKCPNETLFITAGYGGKALIYNDPTASVNRLRTIWNQLAPPEWHANTAAETGCHLIGYGNIFGRYLSGVERGQECVKAADKRKVTNLFVHVEQDKIIRESTGYDTWTKVLKAVFEPIKTF